MDVGAVGPHAAANLVIAAGDIAADLAHEVDAANDGAVQAASVRGAGGAAESAAGRDAVRGPAGQGADMPAALRDLGTAARLAAVATAVDALLQTGLQPHEPAGRAGEAQATAEAAESALMQSDLSAAPADAATPHSSLDTAHAQVASAQVTARPASPAAGELRGPDEARDAMANQPDGLVDIGIQATPATLSSMHVEAGWMWPMFYPGSPNAPLPAGVSDDDEARRRADDDADARAAVDEPEDDESDEDAAAEDDDEAQPKPAADGWVEAADTDWCEPLERSLRTLLAHGDAPAALKAAAEQWQRGRCVVLCCPQGDDPWGPAWAFVLWPKPRGTSAGPRAAAHALPLNLRGERLPALLQWAHERGPGSAVQWWQERTVKEHHPQRGRQLYTLPAGHGEAAAAAVDCELQLGPVLSRTPRWRAVCVRVAAARRFWAALATQWSVQLVVCSRPLLAPSASMEVPSC